MSTKPKAIDNLRPDLGYLCKDNVTGYEGICVAKTKWLNGCIRVTLQAQGLDKEGKVKPSETFDEPQVSVLKASVVSCGRRDTGGPIKTPSQHAATPRK